MPPAPLSLTSSWYIAPGKEAAAAAALRRLAEDVYAKEPGTLTYLIHTPFSDDGAIQSLPPVNGNAVLFFETYRDPQAFLAHLNGPVFTDFVARNGSLFLNSNGKPFTTVQFVIPIAGFTRTESSVPDSSSTGNRHPSVMFEIIAQDQASLKDFYTAVFGWQYQSGTGGFAYVHFPEKTPPLLGGIGQTQPNTPGFEPGHNFYILVDDLDAAIQRAVAAGGKRYVDPTSVDGYYFAMIHDPENNPIGLILPFEN